MMDVQARVNPSMADDSDEDDRPLVFKRSNTTSKQSHSNTEVKRSSLQNHDSKSGGQRSDIRSSNGQKGASAQKGTVSSSKSPPVRSPLASPQASSSSVGRSPLASPQPSSSSVGRSPLVSPKASSSSAKPATGKPPVSASKASTSAAEKSKHSSQPNVSPVVKEERLVKKPPIEPRNDDEDSEDDKPLSSRLSVGLSRGSPSPAKKVLSTASPRSSPLPSSSPRIKEEDSDDEKPLSSKIQFKPNVSSSSKVYDSDDEKPLSSKIQQNGSSIRDNQSGKTNVGLNKRPSSEAKSSGLLPVKKPKLSDASTPTTETKSSGLSPVKKPKLSDASTPTTEAKSSGLLPVKKPKLSDASTATIKKSVSAKKEINPEDDENDHLPISKRMKKASPSGSKSSSLKKTNKNSKKVMKKSKYSKPSKLPPGSGEGKKWTSLEHNGVIFPPPYKPHGVKILYKGKPVDLTPEQEEVATMYAVMKDTEYMKKDKFKENFWTDWRKILGKNHIIQDLDLCNFDPIYDWHLTEKAKKQQMTTEEKKAIKEEKMKLEEKYMWATVDGVKEKVGNFRVEPPGLFRGRGEHPKMGKLKKRIRPSDITINIGKYAPVPECPIPGESWKEVRHDNTVTWLAYWYDPINPKEFKYVFLAASSSLKGQSDKEKYEKARLLKGYIQGIRTAYTKDFASKDETKKQIAVATYLIDKLALRAGNEKDDDEADTVGCCTLKVENVESKPPNILKFDFLGKDSIRYENEVEVELPVYKAIQQFRSGKKGGDNLFDALDTSKLNAHLKELMPGLTAKVFRTYNASITLDEMLSKETKGGDVAQKVLVYQHANKEVAIICNHQRSVSKTHDKQMDTLNKKIDEQKARLEELQIDLSRAKKGKPPLKGADGKPRRNMNPESIEKQISQTNAKIEKMERDKDTKENLKTVALGTSKINYLDPRITVAWCKREDVPIEKMFNKSLLAKFAWAMEVEPSFRF